MTPEVEKKRRELFREWMSGQLKLDQYTPEEAKDEIFRIESGYGQYQNNHIQTAWAGFNAALDAVEIVLPPSAQGTDGQKWLPVKAVEYAITATGLGLRIKE